MSALADWLQTITVHEDMPDLDENVGCVMRGCGSSAASLIVWDCTACGRIGMPYCQHHVNAWVEYTRKHICFHDPCNGHVDIGRVVPL